MHALHRYTPPSYRPGLPVESQQELRHYMIGITQNLHCFPTAPLSIYRLQIKACVIWWRISFLF
jgi:hypothetical protein